MTFKLNGAFFLIAAICMVFISCGPNPEEYREKAANPDFIRRSVKQVSDVIVHDIFSPPIASRIYAYTSIASYEALRNDYPEYKSLAGQINGLEAVPQPESGKLYCFPLAAVQAHLTVGKALIFSENMIEDFKQTVYKEFNEMGVKGDVFENSVQYGDSIARHILAWADKDNYKETRTATKYSLSDEPGRWKPTPPAYMDGIEPHWREIRTLVLDSAQQFAPPPPTPFDTDKNSKFYKETMEVYNALKEGDTEERLAIAKFWDCNPYVSSQVGHVMFATKKITPGGHWVGITSLTTKKAESNIMETSNAFTRTSIALMDAFISCWDEKYRSNLIRPETVINTYIDEGWAPALQTPPFPEHTSGHSVISRAAAITLTDIYGDNFAFVDSVEVEYGLPVRTFDSFLEASEEAALSRLYGGIHYRPAIDYGVEQGEKVGKFIAEKLVTKPE